MKLITRDTDYAVRALCFIAASKDKALSVNVLAKKLCIPRPFLRKILQTLNKNGVLISVKGKGGGFSFSKIPGDITVFDMIEIFQGPFLLSEHTAGGKTCPEIKTCPLRKKLDALEGEVAKELKSITIASLIKRSYE